MEIGHLVARGPRLPHTVVDAIETEPLGGGQPAAGVFHPQPRLVLADDDERLTAPLAHGPHVAEVFDLIDVDGPYIPERPRLGEPVGRLRRIQPQLALAARTGFVLRAAPARYVPVSDHGAFSSSVARSQASRSGS